MSVVLLGGLPVLAQSSSELERKYGRPNNHLVTRRGYEVRPGVIMTVSFAPDGQICEALIEPDRVTEAGVDWGRRIPAALAREVVDEIVPIAQRGRQIGGMTMGNYTSLSWMDYDRVKIISVLVGVGGPEEELKVDEVRVKWKERRCQ
jgi:hypothetical protein